jgi:hypothetical protein
MDPIQIATKITTPLALAAFVAALAFYAYRLRLSERRKTLEAALPKDRPRLIEGAIRDFTILHAESLTNDQKYLLIREELRHRMRRFSIAAIVAVVVTLASAVTLVVLEKKDQPMAGAMKDVTQRNGKTGPKQDESLREGEAGVPRNVQTTEGQGGHANGTSTTTGVLPSGPADLISLRRQDQVKKLSDMYTGKPIDRVPNGVMVFVPPWLIPCDSKLEYGVESAPAGTSILELHKLSNGQVNVVLFVSPADAKKIRARQSSLEISAFAERWVDQADVPVSLPVSEILSCKPVSTESHGERVDLVLQGP